ncbi:MAG TPA: hypothetical protein VET23_01740 [Chitinophagaceae bacterium]|nr:hypothetical protein [Chitinophagaceae bacterium]
MAKTIMVVLIAAHFFSACFAQNSKPAIGTDADIKEKLLTIKNAFPDLVKAFGSNGRTAYGITEYQPRLKIGKAIIDLSQNALGQKLEINFSNIYYSGTENDFLEIFTAIER